MSETPNGAVILATFLDKAPVDITEHVKAAYDLVVGSMDWGSGFLTFEDAVPLAELARICGFDPDKECESYMRRDIEDAKKLLERKVLYGMTESGAQNARAAARRRLERAAELGLLEEESE